MTPLRNWLYRRAEVAWMTTVCIQLARRSCPSDPKTFFSSLLVVLHFHHWSVQTSRLELREGECIDILQTGIHYRGAAFAASAMQEGSVNHLFGTL